ncbi:M20/M25/M40 family metallo-hydrolase [Ferruginibacter paludis]|uniref:M20/M25/M40 family metallo-hydrolase n=1 Tax=Ferruginibacter paludis TaxID=1310417 RepID=UPI0025B4559C|nr:M20/M25/M40 family metallo-hydrolase [Ferruginibacter paludis]MDN3657031.1 M20/M25/M40 family metallo-hydrolase [Ferruginibacter paludis]
MTKLTFTTLIFLTVLSSFISTHLMAQNTVTKNAKKEKVKPAMPLYEKYIDDNMDAHLKEFVELVSIPSISSIPSNKPDVEKAAAWIQNKLRAIGIPTTQLIPTDGNPVVYGSWDKAPGKPTVLIYAHYDVQPVKESEWDNPPFAPVIKDGKIFGRGASDDKSGVMTTIWAVEAMLSTNGKLPVNVKFMFEGNEEVGSPYFKDFLIKNKDLLKADFALNADDGQIDENNPAMTVSLRGAAQMEFSIKTANTDAHSGEFGGKTPNAVLILSQIISSFYDNKGNVAVEGFYDKVVPVSPQQKEMIKKIPYDPATDMKILGTTAEAGDTSFSPLERIWFRPTLEIVGMQGGYTAAEGHSNIIPGNAMARITCRLVSNQNGKEIIDLIVKHINKNCPPGATVTYKFGKGYASPMQLPADTKEYRYISDVLSTIYGKQPLQLATGGSVGSLLSIKEILGLNAYPLGFELSDEKWHAANEFFRISSVRRGQLIYCNYLQYLADEEAKLKK